MLDKKLFIRCCVIVTAYIISLRLTAGISSTVCLLLSLKWIATRDYGKAAMALVLTSWTGLLSPALVGGGSFRFLVAKGAFLITTGGFVLAAINKRFRYGLPFAWLFVYVGYMIFPSMTGWFPVVSYLKLTLFTVFVGGAISAARLLQQNPKHCIVVRHMFMAITALSVVGSAIAYFFPSVGYSMQIAKLANVGIEVDGAEFLQQGGMRLFSGIFCHSQTCGPVIALLMAIIFCDMLFVEGKFAKLHCCLLAIAPVLLYLTRSRTALLIALVAIIVVSTIGIKNASLSIRVKRKAAMVAKVCIALMVVGAIVMEYKSGTITAWVFKGAENGGDVSTVEAVTATRMGKIEASLEDFKRNPLFGMGFQVDDVLVRFFKLGLVSYFSAPVEKGVLPTMILGEGGIIGSAIFWTFIFIFYVSCFRRKFGTLLSMFTIFLATNMGEAVFFSPSATGGFGWLVCVVGGFAIDLISLQRKTSIRTFGLRRSGI